MRGLIHSTSKTIAALVFGVLLTFCSLGAFTVHAKDMGGAQTSCNASCHSHSQGTAINGQDLKTEEDDDEPAPPLTTWLQVPANLAALYIIPVFGLIWLVTSRHKILLTTQLRI